MLRPKGTFLTFAIPLQDGAACKIGLECNDKGRKEFEFLTKNLAVIGNLSEREVSREQQARMLMTSNPGDQGGLVGYCYCLI